jgi:tRNA(Ile)-lysidine synthetase-like protein
LVPVATAGERTALDAGRVGELDGGGLVLRAPRPGDRLRLARGGRKLQDVLIDRKLPRALRADLPVLARHPGAAGDELLWVHGSGAAHDLRPTPWSTMLLTIACGPSPGEGEAPPRPPGAVPGG